jgi:hypothetical protein
MGPGRGTPRGKSQVTRFFDGLELAEPGIAPPQLWRPAGPVPEAEIMLWCAVARKG